MSIELTGQFYSLKKRDFKQEKRQAVSGPPPWFFSLVIR